MALDCAAEHPNIRPVCRGTLLLNLQTFWKLQISRGDRLYVCVSSKMERKRGGKRRRKGEKRRHGLCQRAGAAPFISTTRGDG